MKSNSVSRGAIQQALAALGVKRREDSGNRMNYVLTVEPGFINFSAFAFRRWALHYYKCRHDFVNPHKFSPVPYFFLCRAIELELKARHLEKKRQPEVRQTFRHRIKSAYLALPKRQQTLNARELAVLKQANAIYATKGFEYIPPRDAATAYKRLPDIDALDRVAKKLLAI